MFAFNLQIYVFHRKEMSKGPWWYGFKERLSGKQWCKGLKADNETECIKLGWWMCGKDRVGNTRKGG